MESKVIAIVNGVEILESDVDMFIVAPSGIEIE